MKKTLLTVMLLTCFNIAYAAADGTDNISLLEGDDGFIHVSISGNGEICYADFDDDYRVLSTSDCLQITNSKKIKILCTKKKKICKTISEVRNAINNLSSNNVYNKPMEDYIIKGSGEECRVSRDSKGLPIATNCLEITNSKGIKIFCTAKKKMCKTVSEVRNAFNDTYSPQPNTSGMEALRQGMNYSQARQIILNSGWQGISKRWQDVPKSGQVHERYYTNGWKEIDSCASTGLAPCRFEFKDINNKTLVVITEGECLTSDGKSPKKGEKCDLSISSWTFGEAVKQRVASQPQPTQVKKETSWFDDLKNIAQATYNQVANVPPKCSDANVLNKINTMYTQMRARDLANAGLGGMAMSSLIPTSFTRIEMARAVRYDDSIQLRACRANAIVTVSNRDIAINIAYSVQISEQYPNQYLVELQPGITDEIARAIYGK